MLKTLFWSFCVLVSTFLFSPNALAQNSTEGVVNIYLFSLSSCAHCQRESEFLAKLSSENPGVLVHEFEISDPGNASLLKGIGQEYDVEFDSVPVTFIGSEYMLGFESAETSGKDIINLVEFLRANGDSDEIGEFIFQRSSLQVSPGSENQAREQDSISEPKHPIDKILEKFKADIILGGILILIIAGFLLKKFRRNKVE